MSKDTSKKAIFEQKMILFGKYQTIYRKNFRVKFYDKELSILTGLTAPKGLSLYFNSNSKLDPYTHGEKIFSILSHERIFLK